MTSLIAAKRAAALGGLTLALGAGALAPATAATAADAHAAGKATRTFDVCLPKSIANCAKPGANPKVRAKGTVYYVPRDVLVKLSASNKSGGLATVKLTFDRKSGRDVVKSFKFGRTLPVRTIRTGIPSSNLKKITVTLCKGAVCRSKTVPTPVR